MDAERRLLFVSLETSCQQAVCLSVCRRRRRQTRATADWPPPIDIERLIPSAQVATLAIGHSSRRLLLLPRPTKRLTAPTMSDELAEERASGRAGRRAKRARQAVERVRGRKGKLPCGCLAAQLAACSAGNCAEACKLLRQTRNKINILISPAVFSGRTPMVVVAVAAAIALMAPIGQSGATALKRA